jgi:hypothetical protein
MTRAVKGLGYGGREWGGGLESCACEGESSEVCRVGRCVRSSLGGSRHRTAGARERSRRSSHVLRLKITQARSRALVLVHCQGVGCHVISSLSVDYDGHDFHHPSNGPLSHRYGGAVWLCRCCVGGAVKLQHFVVDSGSPLSRLIFI